MVVLPKQFGARPLAGLLADAFANRNSAPVPVAGFLGGIFREYYQNKPRTTTRAHHGKFACPHITLPLHARAAEPQRGLNFQCAPL